MEFIVKTLKTKKTVVQVCQLKWENSWIFIVEASKGTITCGSFDLNALNGFGLAAAKVLPGPGEEAYSIEEFVCRKITHVNELASNLGVKVGLTIHEAVEKLL